VEIKLQRRNHSTVGSDTAAALGSLATSYCGVDRPSFLAAHRRGDDDLPE